MLPPFNALSSSKRDRKFLHCYLTKFFFMDPSAWFTDALSSSVDILLQNTDKNKAEAFSPPWMLRLRPSYDADGWKLTINNIQNIIPKRTCHCNCWKLDWPRVISHLRRRGLIPMTFQTIDHSRCCLHFEWMSFSETLQMIPRPHGCLWFS